jgi:superfamily II DNA or RNA helicase
MLPFKLTVATEELATSSSSGARPPAAAAEAVTLSGTSSEPSPPPKVHASCLRITSTYQIAVRGLPRGWERAEWFTALTLKPVCNPCCPVKPAPLRTAYMTQHDTGGTGARDVVVTKNGDTLHVPRFLGLRMFGTPPEDERTYGRSFSPGAVARPAPPRVCFAATLNAVQVVACDAALTQLRDVGGAMLVLPCGFGKTVCALWLALTLGRQTLVLVHSEALADQWRDRVSTFLPGCRVGRIQRDIVDTDGCAIVVCMIQSLVKREYTPELLRCFGLVIVDEAHHVAAPLFSTALGKLPARHVLGLSATPDRTDGLGAALEMFLGPIAFRAQRGREHVEVQIVKFTRGAEREVLDRKGNPMCSTMITNLASDGPRTVLIKELVSKQIVTGRNVIVLSDRLDQLGVLKTMLVEDHPDAVIAQVVGGTKPAARDHGFEHASVILSTYHYASEGIDIPRLDTLVLATPRGTIEQSVGRILRPFATKKRPRVIDVKDPFSMFEGMSWKRHRYYKSQNYNVQFTDDVEEEDGEGGEGGATATG